MTRPAVWLWLLFGAEAAGAFLWALRVDRSDPVPRVEGTTRAGMRFDRSEPERQRIYRELVRGEPRDRAAAAHESESAIWNRNHDSYFHQRELRRIAGVSARERIPLWMGFLILDEGMRQHWPPPAGVEVWADDAPLAPVTRPLHQRHLIAAGTPEGQRGTKGSTP